MNDQRTKDRIGDTFEAHFGVRSAFQAKEVKDKIAMTVLAKYGAPKYT